MSTVDLWHVADKTCQFVDDAYPDWPYRVRLVHEADQAVMQEQAVANRDDGMKLSFAWRGHQNGYPSGVRWHY